MESKSIKVLLVEDDPDFASLLQESLTGSLPGLRVDLPHVTRLSDALRETTAGRFDAVLLDLSLPDSQGLETFSRLHTRIPTVPIIVLTGQEDENSALAAMRQGAQDYLFKRTVDLKMLGRILQYAIERKRVGEALREREEFYRLITENVTDLVAVVDRDGKRLFNSPSYRLLLGDPEKLRGSNSFDEIHPEDRDRIRRIFRETIDTGIGQRTEYRLVLRDGGVRHVDSQGNVIKDEFGKPSKVVVISRDITERKRVEEALREGERRYRRLLESTTDYIYTATVENGRVTSTVHGPGCVAVTGYTSAEYESDPYLWYRMIHEEDREAVVEQANQVIAGVQAPPVEHRIQHRDGSIRWVKNTSVVRKDESGRVIAYDGLVSDITERRQAEEQLRHSEALYHSLVESLPQNIFRKDLDGRFTFVNQRFCATLSRTPEEVIGKTDFHFFPAELARKYQEDDQRVIQSHQILETVEELRRSGAEKLYVHVVKIPIYDAQGQITGIQGIFWDITERQRGEEALARERNLLRTLIDNLPDYIYVKDTHYRYLLDNVSHTRLLGAAKTEEVIGKTAFDYFPRDLAAQYDADDQAILRSGQPLLSREEPLVDRQGNKLWVSTTKVPLRDGQGGLIGLVGIGRDITERRRMEEDRDRFFTLSLDMLCIAGFDGYYKQLNPAWEKTLGYSKAELMASPYLELVHPEDRESTVAENRKLLAGKSTVTFENRFRCKDGSYKWFLWNAAPFAEQHLIYATARDITERKRAEEQLRQAYAELARGEESLRKALADLKKSHEELKTAQLHLIRAEKLESVGTLAAGVAHEVKNPLQIILLGVRYLSSQMSAQDETVKSVLDDMSGAVSRADTIVRGLLEFSSSPQMELREQQLNPVVEQALWLVNYELTSNHITLEQTLGKDLPSLRLDRIKIEQVFINIFINAIHAMPTGGALAVKTSAKRVEDIRPALGERTVAHLPPAEPLVVAEVEDTGTGIPEEKLTKIFDPFFTTKPTGKGTGLGLTVVKNIIDMHGGIIDIRNRPQGGVKVTIVFRTRKETTA